MSPISAAVAVICLLLVAGILAYLLVHKLRDEARVERNGVKLGGTIAGTVVLFSLLIWGITKLVASPQPAPLPPLEVRAFGENGEQVLTTLALTPERQLLTPEKFAHLDADDFLVLNDSLGIAIERPNKANWVAGPIPELVGIDASDVPFIGWLTDVYGTGLSGGKPPRPAVFGVQHGTATRLELSAASVIDGVQLAKNPFRDRSFAAGWIQAADNLSGDRNSPQYYALSSAEKDSMADFFRRLVDGAIRSRLPIMRDVHSGVYVEVYRRGQFPVSPMADYLNESFWDRAAGSIKAGLAPPHLLFANNDEELGAFNQSVRLEHITLSGRDTTVILNNVGYLVGGDDVVYGVTLQYLSTEPPDVLRELQRFFESVRIRRPPLSSARRSLSASRGVTSRVPIPISNSSRP